MSNNQIWISLLVPFVGLLGIVIGFISALTVSRRATQTAFRQALYGGQLSRQQDVLTTFYELIGAMHDELLFLPYESREDVADKEEFHQALLRATSYGKKHHIWVPAELWEKCTETIDLLHTKHKELKDAAGDESLTHAEYELVRERVHQWTQGEGIIKLVQLAKAMMTILGLKERGVFILSEEVAIGDLQSPRQGRRPTRTRPRYSFR